MTLYIIRHGKTKANEKRLYCGRTDLPLSDGGRRELLKLKRKKNYPNASLYITSGLRRAEETLEVLYNEKPYIVMPQFAEIDFGEFEMKSHEELEDDAFYQSWLEDTNARNCPSGESGFQFRERVLRGFDELCRTADEDSSIVLVTHGGVIATIMENLRPGEKNYYQWQPKCGHGYFLYIPCEGNSEIEYQAI